MDPVANPAVQLVNSRASHEVHEPQFEQRKSHDSHAARNDSHARHLSGRKTSTTEQAIPLKDLCDEQPHSAPSDPENSGYIDPEDSFPEGGLDAWLVTLSAFLTLFPSFGFMVSI
ncbi:hypothetical protein LTS18_012236, partial [Coniosporium uncinatum]